MNATGSMTYYIINTGFCLLKNSVNIVTLLPVYLNFDKLEYNRAYLLSIRLQ